MDFPQAGWPICQYCQLSHCHQEKHLICKHYTKPCRTH